MRSETMHNLVRTSGSNRRALLAASLAVAVSLAGCGDDSLLDVEDPDNVTQEVLEGPQGVAARTNGLIGDFQEAYDDWVNYTGLFTDEFILSGTFETRIDVDRRNVQANPVNASLNEDLYEPLHVSRRSADTAVAIYRNALDDPEFSEVTGDLREGIALGLLYGGYVRIFLAEGYCQSIIGGPEGEAGPLLPDARMEEALGILQEAETAAQTAGLSDLATAARIGQARALMWLGDHGAAADTVSAVPDGFVYVAEYSGNSVDQYNEVYARTFGDVFNLRWTVGDGDDFPREFEIFAPGGDVRDSLNAQGQLAAKLSDTFDEWVSLGLIDLDSGLEALEIGVDVALQQLYTARSSPIPIATGWEARMIEAEALLRDGQRQEAEDLVNRLLEGDGRSANPMLAINPDLGGDDGLLTFDPVDFTGDVLGSPPTFEENLAQLARARAAGNWMSGQRQGYFRRWREGDGLNLYPDHSPRGGDDISFPIPQQEIDNNENVTSACP